MCIIAPDRICRLHRVFCQKSVPEKWGFPPRRNKDQHLIYIRSGQGYYLLEQEGRLNRIDFIPGMVIFVPAGTLHGGYMSNDHNRPRIIPIRFGFYSSGFQAENETLGEDSSFMIETPVREPVVYMTRLSPWWRETFEHICQIYSEDRYSQGAMETCGSLLESLLRVLEWEQNQPLRGLRSDRLYQIRTLMDESCENNHPLSWFAQQADLSEKHFQKLFRKEFGRTPMEFYRQKKMERAVVLLQDTHMSIEDVGRRLGYADGFSFSRAFKKYYGFSPRRIRD